MSSVREVWEMQCPKCGKDDKLDVVARITVRLVPDGTDRVSDHSQEWDKDSVCDCWNCRWSGTVGDAIRAYRTTVTSTPAAGS